MPIVVKDIVRRKITLAHKKGILSIMSMAAEHEIEYYPPGPLAIRRNTGSTETERDLALLVDRTFLKIWSYPRPWRRQRNPRDKTGDGKELCDLLVVFDQHVIIFSDKNIAFQTGVDERIAWRRWYRRSIKESAKQIFAAERWIREFPERLYVDSRCTIPLPVKLPDVDDLIVHRIVVARGAGEDCKRYFREGSGSLMIMPRIKGDEHLLSGGSEADDVFGGLCRPFMVGQVDPRRGYVHVFDDATLGILLNTLDTARDFIDYLVAKERLIASGMLAAAAGEEDLLAYYLKDVGPDGRHGFIFPKDTQFISLDQGFWEEYQKNPQRLAQIEANRISYIWDELIERFSFHALNDSQYKTTARGVGKSELAIRFLAREPRTRRRILAEMILDIVDRTKKRDALLEASVLTPSEKGDPYYVIMAFRRPPGKSYDEYRDKRMTFLQAYINVAKLRFPEAIDLVGVAWGYEGSEGRTGGSEDLLYYDARKWSSADQLEAEDLQKKFGFLKDVRIHTDVVKTYPDVASIMKGGDRNKGCFCHSGLKFKRCHGRR